MSTYIVDGPCPKPRCGNLVDYGIDHVNGVRVLAGICKVCGSYRAYDGAKNVEVISED